MLFFVEIAMLIGGIYALVTGRVPGFLVGGGKYQVEGTTARWFGVLLILPLPVALVGAFLLALLYGKDGARYASVLEILAVSVVAILAMVLVRVVGKPVEPVDDIERKIAKKAQGALMYTVFSATGLGAPVFCPLAIIYANQALKLIDEHHVGEQHRRKAKTARAIAAVVTSLWALGALIFIGVMLVGS